MWCSDIIIRKSYNRLNSSFVGQFAKNLEEELSTAQEQGRLRGLPSLLCFDEGSSIAQQAQSGASGVSKHYQEAIDEFKRFIGNECGDMLVVSISTNLLQQEFEEAMTREGRLATFFIPFPSPIQKARMWKHFLGKYKVLDITPEQAKDIEKLCSGASGAFIEEFSRAYKGLRRKALLRAKGYQNLISAMRKEEGISEKEVMRSISYDTFVRDLAESVSRVQFRNGGREGNKREAGFHTSMKEKQ